MYRMRYLRICLPEESNYHVNKIKKAPLGELFYALAVSKMRYTINQSIAQEMHSMLSQKFFHIIMNTHSLLFVRICI